MQSAESSVQSVESSVQSAESLVQSAWCRVQDAYALVQNPEQDIRISRISGYPGCLDLRILYDIMNYHPDIILGYCIIILS